MARKDRIDVHGSYNAQLLDPRWKKRRADILQKDGNKCAICGASGCKLEVHHRQYHFIERLNEFKRPWEYDDINLITLCEYCHAKGHNHYQVPIIYI